MLSEKASTEITYGIHFFKHKSKLKLNKTILRYTLCVPKNNDSKEWQKHILLWLYLCSGRVVGEDNLDKYQILYSSHSGLGWQFHRYLLYYK